MSSLFPVFLKLEGRPVLLVGGGRVAAGKLVALLQASSSVTIVAPHVCPEFDLQLAQAAPRPGFALHLREFAPSDLDGAWLAIAAATPEVNRLVARAAGERRVFVNAVDDPESASAYSGAVIRRGDVTLAVSTGGIAPALAGLLREALESILPEDVAEWAATASRLRHGWKTSHLPIGRRRPLLLDALNAIYEKRAAEALARSS